MSESQGWKGHCHARHLSSCSKLRTQQIQLVQITNTKTNENCRDANPKKGQRHAKHLSKDGSLKYKLSPLQLCTWCSILNYFVIARNNKNTFRAQARQAIFHIPVIGIFKKAFCWCNLGFIKIYRPQTEICFLLPFFATQLFLPLNFIGSITNQLHCDIILATF